MRPVLPVLAAAVALAAVSSAAGQSYSTQSARPAPGYERPEAAERPEAPEPPEGGQDQSQALVRQLNLRPDQQAAFREYQSAFQAQSQDHDDGGDDVSRLAAMTTPQRLDDTARQMDRDRADFERVATATRRFYGVLDAGQKRTFDQITAPQADPGDAEDDDRAPPNSGPASSAPPRR